MKSISDIGTAILSFFRDENGKDVGALVEVPAKVVHTDWITLLRGLADAIVPFANAEDDDSDEAMIKRMGRGALVTGVEALEWLDGETRARKIVKGLRSKKSRDRALEALALNDLAPRLSPTLERAASVYLAGAGSGVVVNEDGQRVRTDKPAPISRELRQRAQLLCFHAYARELNDLRAQFELAGSANAAVSSAGRALAKAFEDASIVETRPAKGSALDLQSARAVGFHDGEENDRVHAVRKVGITYRGGVLRKAEVVVTRQKRAAEPAVTAMTTNDATPRKEQQDGR